MDTFRKRASAKQCREHRWLARKPTAATPASSATTSKAKTAAAAAAGAPVVAHQPPVAPKVKSKQNAAAELDVAKDNLRVFVERWREHPDSPYTIEHSRWTLERPNSLETISLQGQTPSPCGSICSSAGTADSSQSPENLAGGLFLAVPDLALERRASEGHRPLDKIDPASQILLAEEIIRLSEHLRSIAVPSPNSSNATCSTDDDSASAAAAPPPPPRPPPTGKIKKSPKKSSTAAAASASATIKKAENQMNEISEKLSNITKQRKLNGTTFNGNRNPNKYNNVNDKNSAPSGGGGGGGGGSDGGGGGCKSSLFNWTKRAAKIGGSGGISASSTMKRSASEEQPRPMDLTPPWRQARVKRRFGETCRDVPRIATLQDLHKTMNLDEPTSTKNLLLKLIDEWGEMKRPAGGRKSISFDWCGEDSVARKSINSLAEYFQSEQQKAVTTAPSAAGRASSIHR